MSDNTLQQANETIATDELSTLNTVDVSGVSPRIKAQRVKAGYGSDGDFNDVDATHPLPVAIVPETVFAGATPFKLISAASTNATSVKASAGKVYAIAAFNLNASPRYLKLYDKASAPTVGSDVPKWVLMLPGGTAGAGFVAPLPMPLKFTVGIAFALTTGIADADTAAVLVNEIVVNLGYV